MLATEQGCSLPSPGAWFTGWADSGQRGFREEQDFRKGFRWGQPAFTLPMDA
jgi:hypothetical protein